RRRPPPSPRRTAPASAGGARTGPGGWPGTDRNSSCVPVQQLADRPADEDRRMAYDSLEGAGQPLAVGQAGPGLAAGHVLERHLHRPPTGLEPPQPVAGDVALTEVQDSKAVFAAPADGGPEEQVVVLQL